MCNFPKYVLTKDWDTDKRNYKLVEVPIDPSGVAGIEPTGSLSQEGWRPIKTAPRDGTPVLGYENGPSIVWYEDWGWDDGTWGERPAPTHWQPLPPPPLT